MKQRRLLVRGFLAVALVVVGVLACERTSSADRQVVASPEDARLRKEYVRPSGSFSQAVVVDAGLVKTIYVSGQVGRGGDDAGTQASQAFANLSSTLEDAGATTADVVKLNLYVVGRDPETNREIAEAMRAHFPGDNRPASTWVWVESLVSPDYLIEVEAVAVVGR